MAIGWVLYSVIYVLGYPMMNNTEEECKNIGDVKCAKGFSPAKNLNEVDHYPYSGFQMPLHYPRYTKQNYDSMEEWKVDLLLQEYGLNFKGTLDEKRAFAIGAFLWPGQY